MKMETLHEFATVAKHLNITKAAQELYTSQPSLSSRMSALEKELGCPLLDRSRSRIALTPAGSVLLDYAQRIIALYDEALEKSKAASKLSPSVRVASIPSDSPYRSALPPYETVPYSFVDLDAGTSAADALRQGVIDVAIGSDCPTASELGREAESSGIAYRRIGEDVCFLAMMADHPLAGKERLSRRDLDGQTVVINNGFHFDRWNKMVRLLLGDDVKLNFRMNALDSMGALSFAKLGSSVYLCEGKASQALLAQRDDVKVHERLDGKVLALPTALACRSEDLRNGNGRIRRFVDEFLRHASTIEAVGAH